MRNVKLVIGVIGGMLPIAYCAYLLYYFRDVGGSIQGAQDIGLGPTMLGLGVICVLFCIGLIIRIVWIFMSEDKPGSGDADGGGTRRRPLASEDDGDAGFDADAVIARHMAQRTAETAPAPAPPAPRNDGAPTQAPSFGRRVR